MPQYLVTIPIAGSISKIIEAANDRQAIRKGMAEEGIIGHLEVKNGWELDDLNRYQYLSQGNVNYVDVDEATAEEQEGP
jgi:hypothetical protein